MAMTSEVKTKLANMLVDDIGPKEVLDGITYILLTNTGKDAEKITEFTKLQKEIADCGIDPNTIIRKYDVSNGAIFDMNLNVAKQTSAFVTQSMIKAGAVKGANITNADLIGDGPDKRRYEDIVKLAKFLVKSAKERKSVVEIALFSRNKVGKTTFNAKRGNEDVAVTYNAYAIRHWDIQQLNQLLQREGISVVNVEAGEIIPSKNGVRFKLTLGRVG